MTEEKSSALGPVGQTVVENVEELRRARGLSFRDLSDRLAEIGRPILPTVLHRLSRGKRRVDADDLVALAIALDVNPSALLLPRSRLWEEPVELTPRVDRRMYDVWRWADGSVPLPPDPSETPLTKEAEARTYFESAADFAVHARPNSGEFSVHPAAQAIFNLGGRVSLLLRDFGNPMTHDRRRRAIETALRKVQLELEELLAESDDVAVNASPPDPAIAPGERAPRALGGPWEARDAARTVRPAEPPAPGEAGAAHTSDPFSEGDRS